jgi:hypothetical protein
MANPISPSPLLEVFVNEARASLPKDESDKIAPHGAAIAQTTSQGDPHRARLCVKWAIEMADDHSQPHPHWAQLKERLQIWKDDWFAFDFGVADALPGTGSHHVVGNAMPIEDVRIEWVQDAVAVAKRLGEDDGWENSPWESLLVDLIDVEAGSP